MLQKTNLMGRVKMWSSEMCTLSCYEQYAVKYSLLCVNLMVTTQQIPIVDTQKIERDLGILLKNIIKPSNKIAREEESNRGITKPVCGGALQKIIKKATSTYLSITSIDVSCSMKSQSGWGHLGGTVG